MSFDKSYPNRKDHRKQYRGSKAEDKWCRRNGIYWEIVKKYKEKRLHLQTSADICEVK